MTAFGLEQEARDLLTHSSLARGLPPTAVAVLADRSTVLERGRDDALYDEDEPARGLFLIVRGVIKLVRELGTGREIIIELVGPGEVIGEAALADDGRHDTRAVCLHPVAVVSIPREEVHAFIRQNPEAARNVIALLHRSLLGAHRRVEDLAVFGVRQRIARLLLRLADWTGREQSGRIHVPLALSRQELADLVGTTMETTIRVMTSLRQGGLVEPARRGVVLRDRAALELVAAGSP
jgi:CRP-like cAMP-binding protein